eukprot:6061072-Pleurochrysis_carterae.AAC.2
MGAADTFTGGASHDQSAAFLACTSSQFASRRQRRPQGSANIFGACAVSRVAALPLVNALGAVCPRESKAQDRARQMGPDAGRRPGCPPQSGRGGYYSHCAKR